MQDQDDMNPRTEWDNLGTMVCWHRRYKLGDEQPSCSPDEYDLPDNAISLPLYLYDHSGITMSTAPFNDRWDSGQVGFIYVTKEKLQAEGLGDKTKDEIESYLRAEVETYDDYLTGAVYQYIILDSEDNIIDSCSGFFGYDHEKSGLLTNAKDEINAILKKKRQKHFSQLKEWIKHSVPLYARKPYCQ